METELTSDLDRLLTRRIRMGLSSEGAANGDIWRRILLAIGEVASARGESWPDQEELALVRSMGSGDGDAAAEVYRRYSERVFRFVCRRVLEQTEDAEEITLDIFITAIDMAGTYS